MAVAVTHAGEYEIIVVVVVVVEIDDVAVVVVAIVVTEAMSLRWPYLTYLREAVRVTI